MGAVVGDAGDRGRDTAIERGSLVVLDCGHLFVASTNYLGWPLLSLQNSRVVCPVDPDHGARHVLTAIPDPAA